jgi:hypothetical protein
MENCALFLATMLHSATNTHFFHWTTDSYAKHKALAKYYDSIIELTDLPDNDSMRFSLSTMVLHLSSTSGYKSKEFFIRSLYKAAANQIAAAKLHEIKERNKPDSTNPPTAA